MTDKLHRIILDHQTHDDLVSLDFRGSGLQDAVVEYYNSDGEIYKFGGFGIESNRCETFTEFLKLIPFATNSRMKFKLTLYFKNKEDIVLWKLKRK